MKSEEVQCVGCQNLTSDPYLLCLDCQVKFPAEFARYKVFVDAYRRGAYIMDIMKGDQDES